MPPLVTISIPLYKCEKFLEKCLISVKNQTYQNIEITLINDQTPDNSVQIAEEFIKKHNLKDWKIFHLEQNSGLSVVRNKGINTAKGKYLYFLDSDDEITSDCIEKLVVVAEKENAQMSISQIECEKAIDGKKSFCLGQLKKTKPLFGNENIFKAFSNGEIPSSAVNKLFLIDFFRENKIYFVPSLFAQDELWTFHSCLKLESVAFQTNVTYTYYLHNESVIHNRKKIHFDNWFTIGQHIDKSLKEEKNPERKRLILNYLIKFKNTTLIMNWKAQKNDDLWKESYKNYQSLSSLRFIDYFSSNYSKKLKKIDFLMSLPPNLGMRIFKKRWYN
ncbi:MAG: glycosyltransferase [Weeksellaceae bacterium]|jgi:glycosyltransferase involved in cell wall biosynthesis|nr:glycosyltransferase [Weeksellaceae bacterium]